MVTSNSLTSCYVATSKQLDVTLRGEIKQLEVKIEQIRSDLARDLKDLEYRMTLKLGTMMVVAVGAMATLVKLL